MPQRFDMQCLYGNLLFGVSVTSGDQKLNVYEGSIYKAKYTIVRHLI